MAQCPTQRSVRESDLEAADRREARGEVLAQPIDDAARGALVHVSEQQNGPLSQQSEHVVLDAQLGLDEVDEVASESVALAARDSHEDRAHTVTLGESIGAIEERTFKDIASKLQKRPATVAALYARALKALKDELDSRS